MKPLLAVVLLFILGCKNPENDESSSMAGAYKMLSQQVKSDSIDSTIQNLEQLKIYTDDFMMYANVNSPDSISGFGVGSYTMNKDTVIENIFYTSNDSLINSTPNSYKLRITKTGKGFDQFINGIASVTGEVFDLTEKYDSVGTNTKTPLDGAWKQTDRYHVENNDTVHSDLTEYKFYYAGHVMWGATWKDSTQKSHTGIGFGTFTMPADNEVNESMTASTFHEVRNKNHKIKIEMMGNDKFRQAIANPDGSFDIEEYERLKK